MKLPDRFVLALRRARHPRAWMAAAAVLASIASAATADDPSASSVDRGSDVISITGGLSDYQVLQRAEGGVASVMIQGRVGAQGTIEGGWCPAGHEQAAPSNWKTLGSVSAGEWNLKLSGLSTGGEYKVFVRLRDESGRVLGMCRREHILVGDIWVLAGQSNMEGYGYYGYSYRKDLETPSPLVHCYESRERWAAAEEPLHWLSESPHRVHSGHLQREERERVLAEARQNRQLGAGLGLSFAKEIVRVTGVPIGLVPCAHGGTSMQQWDPARNRDGDRSLYGSMMLRIQAVGGRIRGVLWYQGESDANAADAPAYGQRLERLIKAIRTDVRSPEMPFYLVQLSRIVRELNLEEAASIPNSAWLSGPGQFIRMIGGPLPWNVVQRSQLRAGTTLGGVATVAAVDLPLDDGVHISTPGQKRLGRRLARVALRHSYGRNELTDGPRLAEIVILDSRYAIRLRFEDVAERLLPERHIAGFSLVRNDGTSMPIVTDALVDPDAPNCVLLRLTRPLMEGAVLWYGGGLNPYCNLVDAADMAVPALGPIWLDSPATSVAP